MSWIRSQDGKELMKAKMLWVGEPFGERRSKCELMAGIGPDRDQGRVIGIFASEEDALAELNCIITWICNERKGVYQVNRPSVSNQKEIRTP